jgi:hypothetical protein
MFARKIRVEYEENGRRMPCPLKWLDSFSMRNFTNASVFDDTLPLGDGVLEIGSKVPLEQRWKIGFGRRVICRKLRGWYWKKGDGVA